MWPISGKLLGKQLHFIGIGGVGMSAVAKLALEQGAIVSGSDIVRNRFIEKLALSGARICIPHAADNLSAADAVIYSSCIDHGNPEVQRAQALQIPLVHRSVLLAQLMRGQRAIAVTGAHGKTTTSAWISYALRHAGWDPTFAIGADSQDLGGNAAAGSGEWFVAEADESDGSFLQLEPDIAVLTNLDREHLDYYGDVSAIKDAYRRFALQLRPHGLLCYWADDDRLAQALAPARHRRLRYSLTRPDAELWARILRQDRNGTEFETYYRQQFWERFVLRVPGTHNVLNALAVLGVGRTLEVPVEKLQSALRTFSGASRRFQVVCQRGGVTLVDDYGHHPTEIEATLATARSWQPQRVVCVFQPHRYSRVKFLREEFGNCFFQADKLVITDVYAAFEKPLDGITNQTIYEQVVLAGHPDVQYVPRDRVVDFLREAVRPGDLVVFSGAGDIGTDAAELGQSLEISLCQSL